MKNVRLNRRKTHEQFLAELKLIQPDLEVVGKYETSTSKILVLNKYGLCNPNAGGLLFGFKPTINSAICKEDYLINQFKEVHGNLYNYSLVKYINAKTNVFIKCECNTIFEVTPDNHITKKSGCPICGKIKQGVNNRKDTDSFIKKSIKIHGDKYNYDKTVYVLNTENLIITCIEHGDFEQTPGNHTNKTQPQGCPDCGDIKKQVKAQNNPSGWTLTNWIQQALKSKYFDSFKCYIIRCWNDIEEFYKIGRTFVTTKKRFSGKDNMPYSYEIITEIIGEPEYIFNLENSLKKEHKQYKYIPKIKFYGMYECFNFIDIDLINKHLKNETKK